MSRRVASVVIASLVLHLLAPSARAAVNVQRSGSENPVQEVAKSTMWGGVAGVTLGLALAVATSGNDRDGDIIRWGFAAGTFFGFGFGMVHVLSRPSSTALIEIQRGTATLHAVVPSPSPQGGLELRVVGVRF